MAPIESASDATFGADLVPPVGANLKLFGQRMGLSAEM